MTNTKKINLEEILKLAKIGDFSDYLLSETGRSASVTFDEAIVKGWAKEEVTSDKIANRIVVSYRSVKGLCAFAEECKNVISDSNAKSGHRCCPGSEVLKQLKKGEDADNFSFIRIFYEPYGDVHNVSALKMEDSSCYNRAASSAGLYAGCCVVSEDADFMLDDLVSVIRETFLIIAQMGMKGVRICTGARSSSNSDFDYTEELDFICYDKKIASVSVTKTNFDEKYIIEAVFDIQRAGMVLCLENPNPYAGAFENYAGEAFTAILSTMYGVYDYSVNCCWKQLEKFYQETIGNYMDSYRQIRINDMRGFIRYHSECLSKLNEDAFRTSLKEVDETVDEIMNRIAKS